MSRSIDSRKRDLIRERKAAFSDGLPIGPEMTDLDRDGIKKIIYKLNATWKRQSVSGDTANHGEAVLIEGKVEKRIRRTRDK